MSNDPLKPGVCWAYLAGRDTVQERLIADYLKSQNCASAVRYARKDADELNELLSKGQYQRVLFPDLETLLVQILDENASLDAWERAGVRIELVSPPGDEPTWRRMVRQVYDSHAAWRLRQSRNWIIGLFLLSIAALMALTVLFGLIPPLH